MYNQNRNDGGYPSQRQGGGMPVGNFQGNNTGFPNNSNMQYSDNSMTSQPMKSQGMFPSQQGFPNNQNFGAMMPQQGASGNMMNRGGNMPVQGMGSRGGMANPTNMMNPANVGNQQQWDQFFGGGGGGNNTNNMGNARPGNVMNPNLAAQVGQQGGVRPGGGPGPAGGGRMIPSSNNQTGNGNMMMSSGGMNPMNPMNNNANNNMMMNNQAANRLLGNMMGGGSGNNRMPGVSSSSGINDSGGEYDPMMSSSASSNLNTMLGGANSHNMMMSGRAGGPGGGVPGNMMQMGGGGGNVSSGMMRGGGGGGGQSMPMTMNTNANNNPMMMNTNNANANNMMMMGGGGSGNTNNTNHNAMFNSLDSQSVMGGGHGGMNHSMMHNSNNNNNNMMMNSSHSVSSSHPMNMNNMNNVSAMRSNAAAVAANLMMMPPPTGLPLGRANSKWSLSMESPTAIPSCFKATTSGLSSQVHNVKVFPVRKVTKQVNLFPNFKAGQTMADAGGALASGYIERTGYQGRHNKYANATNTGNASAVGGNAMHLASTLAPGLGLRSAGGILSRKAGPGGSALDAAAIARSVMLSGHKRDRERGGGDRHAERSHSRSSRSPSHSGIYGPRGGGAGRVAGIAAGLSERGEGERSSRIGRGVRGAGRDSSASPPASRRRGRLPSRSPPPSARGSGSGGLGLAAGLGAGSKPAGSVLLTSAPSTSKAVSSSVSSAAAGNHNSSNKGCDYALLTPREYIDIFQLPSLAKNFMNLTIMDLQSKFPNLYIPADFIEVKLDWASIYQASAYQETFFNLGNSVPLVFENTPSFLQQNNAAKDQQAAVETATNATAGAVSSTTVHATATPAAAAVDGEHVNAAEGDADDKKDPEEEGNKGASNGETDEEEPAAAAIDTEGQGQAGEQEALVATASAQHPALSMSQQQSQSNTFYSDILDPPRFTYLQSYTVNNTVTSMPLFQDIFVNTVKPVKFNAKVLLSCGLKDPMTERVDHNFTRRLRILIGRRKGNVALLGTSWCRDLDGGDPLQDRSCLIHTARRALFAQTLLDIFQIEGAGQEEGSTHGLVKLGEIAYHRPREELKGKVYPEQEEITVLFLYTLQPALIEYLDANPQVFEDNWQIFSRRVKGEHVGPMLSHHPDSFDEEYLTSQAEVEETQREQQQTTMTMDVGDGGKEAADGAAVEEEGVNESKTEGETEEEAGKEEPSTAAAAVETDAAEAKEGDPAMNSPAPAVSADSRPIPKKGAASTSSPVAAVAGTTSRGSTSTAVSATAKQKPEQSAILLAPMPLPQEIIASDPHKKSDGVSLRMLPLSAILSYSLDDCNERIFEVSLAGEMLKSYYTMTQANLIVDVILAEQEELFYLADVRVVQAVHKLRKMNEQAKAKLRKPLPAAVVTVSSPEKDVKGTAKSKGTATGSEEASASASSSAVAVKEETKDSKENVEMAADGENEKDPEKTATEVPVAADAEETAITAEMEVQPAEEEEEEKDKEEAVEMKTEEQQQQADEEEDDGIDEEEARIWRRRFVAACRWFDVQQEKFLRQDVLVMIIHSSQRNLSRADVQAAAEDACKDDKLRYEIYI